MPKIRGTCPLCKESISIEIPEQKKEETMSDQEKTQDSVYCPTCRQPWHAVPELKGEIKNLELEHKLELAEKDNQINRLTEALEQMKQGHTHFTPEEYENCPNCGPELQKYVESKVNQAMAGITASKEEAAKIAKAAGLELMPSRIIIGENLSRRLRR
jgi:uncharacterized protein with PIN domain